MLLIIEKDPKFSAKLKQSVKLEGMKTFLVDSLQDGMYLLESMPADLILANLATLGSKAAVDNLAAAATKRNSSLLLIAGFPNTADLADHVRLRQHGELIELPFNAADLTTRLTRLRAGDDPLIGLEVGPEGNAVEIVRKLGKGAMGEVYEGREVALDRKVAVKFLLADRAQDQEMNRRFRQEAVAVARMRSPHVVRIFFVGAHQGRPYLVMEHIDGPNLASLVRKKTKLEPREALRITREILAGLVHAHKLGMVHRDLKPANIMLNRDGQAIILDFGLVRTDTAQDLTQSGMILGTPRYISPEQIRGMDVDGRADLYAVGIMLYEMLLGRPPYNDKDHVAVLMKHLNEPLPTPDQSEMDPQLFRVVQHLTSKDPDQRPHTASDALDALESYLGAAGFSSVMTALKGSPITDQSGDRTLIGSSTSSASLASTSPGGSRTPSSLRVVRSISFDSKPVPQEVLDDLMSLFTEFLGPLAPKLARKDANAAGLDLGHLPTASWSDLLNTLAARISDEDKREQFVDRAVLLRERF